MGAEPPLFTPLYGFVTFNRINRCVVPVTGIKSWTTTDCVTPSGLLVTLTGVV